MADSRQGQTPLPGVDSIKTRTRLQPGHAYVVIRRDLIAFPTVQGTGRYSNDLAWADLVVMALKAKSAHDTRDGNRVVREYGQIKTTYGLLEKRWGRPYGTVRGWVNKWVDEGRLKSIAIRKRDGLLFTIPNLGKWGSGLTGAVGKDSEPESMEEEHEDS